MTYANVTGGTAYVLPYQWAISGITYAFSSAQGSGCVDTVTPMTANAGGIFNVKGIPLYPAQALAAIQDFDNHQVGAAIPCQSLLNQVSGTSIASTSSTPDYLVQLTGVSLGMGALVDDIGALVLAFVVYKYLLVPIAKEIGLMKK